MQLSQYLPAALKECKCINFDSETLQQALVLVIAAPLIWNIVARTIRYATKHKSPRCTISGAGAEPSAPRKVAGD